jgi:hypothetical protein
MQKEGSVMWILQYTHRVLPLTELAVTVRAETLSDAMKIAESFLFAAAHWEFVGGTQRM